MRAAPAREGEHGPLQATLPRAAREPQQASALRKGLIPADERNSSRTRRNTVRNKESLDMSLMFGKGRDG
ncbi:hypothetical protein CB1_000590012 [Camelus ferus]|nr:hypothetical protein CB1_000590012 [Camelus ferus]